MHLHRASWANVAAMAGHRGGGGDPKRARAKAIWLLAQFLQYFCKLFTDSLDNRPAAAYNTIRWIMAAPTIGSDSRPMAERLEQQAADEAREERKKSRLPRGNAEMLEARAKREAVEAERLTKQQAVVADLFNADVSALPDDIRNNPIVLNALRNKANAQVILNEHYERVHRGAPGAEESLKAIKDFFGQVQAATNDVLTRFSKQQEDKPFQRIPKSVMDWIENSESYEGPIVTQADGS